MQLKSYCLAILILLASIMPAVAQSGWLGGGKPSGFPGLSLPAPSTSGNVLTSNGSIWTSAPAATIATPVSVANGGTGSATAAAHTVFGNTTGSTAAPAYTATPSFTSFATTGASTMTVPTDVVPLKIDTSGRGTNTANIFEIKDAWSGGTQVYVDAFGGLHGGNVAFTHVDASVLGGQTCTLTSASDVVSLTLAKLTGQTANTVEFTYNGTRYGYFDNLGQAYLRNVQSDYGFQTSGTVDYWGALIRTVGGQTLPAIEVVGQSGGSFKVSPACLTSTTALNVGTGTTCTKETFGTATLSSGTVTITDSSITANSVITLTEKAASSVAEMFTVELTAGSGFTIHSNNVASTSVLMWDRKEP
jgi:hypothetical protein